jgi:hypothetical protein
MEILNLFHGELDEAPEGGEPPGYGLGRAVRVGRKIGASQLGLSIYELPKGGERLLEPGDTVCFPAGPDGAHKVWNDADAPARVGLLSTKNQFGIAEYPDSDKVGVWAGGQHYMLRRSAHLDYWDGER